MKTIFLSAVIFLVLSLAGTLVAVNDAGATMGREIVVADSGNDEHLEAIAVNSSSSDLLFVWTKDVGGGDTDLWGRRARFKPSFQWIGGPFAIAESARPELGAALVYNPIDDEFLLVYEVVFSDSDIDIRAQRIAGWAGGGDGGSELRGSSFDVASSVGRETDPAVAFLPSTAHYLVVFEANGDIRGQRLAQRGQGDGGGELIGSAFDIGADAFHLEAQPAIAASTLQSYFVVTYSFEYRPGDFDLRGQRVRGILDNSPELIQGAFEIVQTTHNEHSSDVVYAPHAQAFFVAWQADAAGNRDVRGAWLDERAMSGNPIFAGPFDVAADSVAREYTPSVSIDISSGEVAVALAYWIEGMSHFRLGLVWLNPNPLVIPPLARPLSLFPERTFSYVDPILSVCRGQPGLVLGYTAELNAGSEHDAYFLLAGRWSAALPLILR